MDAILYNMTPVWQPDWLILAWVAAGVQISDDRVKY